jgi:hypothetical protein
MSAVALELLLEDDDTSRLGEVANAEWLGAGRANDFEGSENSRWADSYSKTLLRSAYVSAASLDLRAE